MEAKDVKEKGQAPVTALFRSGACFSVVSHFFIYFFFKLYIYIIYDIYICVCVFFGPPKIGIRMVLDELKSIGSTSFHPRAMTIGFYFHSDYGGTQIIYNGILTHC